MASVDPSMEQDVEGSVKSVASSKRKRTDDYDITDLYRVEKGTLESISEKFAEIIDTLETKHEKGSRLTKENMQYFRSTIDRIQNLASTLAFENVALKGRIREIERIEGMRNEGTLFSDVVKKEKKRFPPVSGTNKALPAKKYSAVVRMKNQSDETTADVVKDKFLKVINPVENKLHVNSVRKLRSKAVVVEVKTQEDLEKIVNSVGMIDSGLEIGVSNTYWPKVQIFDVPSDFSVEQCLDALYMQNSEILGDFLRGDLEKECKFRFRTGRRDQDTTNWVVEVSPVLRNVLRASGKVYVGSYRCRVVDFTRISRCYKCQGYGHISTTCKAEKETCGHCAKDGHSIKGCNALQEARKCAVCKRMGKECTHSNEESCPTYKHLLELQRNKTDYGYQLS